MFDKEKSNVSQEMRSQSRTLDNNGDQTNEELQIVLTQHSCSVTQTVVEEPMDKTVKRSIRSRGKT